MRTLGIGLAVLAAILAGGYAASAHWLTGDAAGESKEMDRVAVVTRGDFRVTIQLKGTLDAIRNHDIICPVRKHEKRLIYVVEDRSHVEKDQIIAKLAPEAYEEDVAELQLKLDDTRRDLALAQEDLRITRAMNFSDIKKYADELRVKREALDKYYDLEYPQMKKELRRGLESADLLVATAAEALATAKDELSAADSNDTEKIEELTDAVTKAEEALAAQQAALAKANHELLVSRRYDHPEKERSLRDEVLRAKLDLDRVVISAKSKEEQAKRKMLNHRFRIQKLERDLAKVKEDLDSLVVRAPVEGIIAYGNRHRRHWEQPKEIKVGTTLSHRETFATIPDLSSFLIKADLPESYRSRIEVGTPVLATSEALPDQEIRGAVATIPVMSTPSVGWDRDSPKVYQIEISVEKTLPGMVPGMTVSVELVTEEVSDVLYVPVEAIYNRAGQTYAQVVTPLGAEERAVEVGRFSESYTEVVKGLEEGEKIRLFRPGHDGP